MSKFIRVTEHYGYMRMVAWRPFEFYKYIYAIYRIQGGTVVGPDMVAGSVTWRDARKECKYLEKLNAHKFDKEEKC